MLKLRGVTGALLVELTGDVVTPPFSEVSDGLSSGIAVPELGVFGSSNIYSKSLSHSFSTTVFVSNWSPTISASNDLNC